MIKKSLKFIITSILLVGIFYGLLGFLIIPGIGLRVINQQLAKYSTQPAKLDRLQLNPFTLEVDLWGLSIGEKNKEIALDHFYTNLQVDSLWLKALHLKEITLDKSFVRIAFNKEGVLNLTRLFNIPSQPETTEKSTLFPVKIDQISLNEGGLSFQDVRPKTPVNFSYDQLTIQLNDLSTLPDKNAQLHLFAKMPLGGTVKWQGTVSLDPISSKGSLQIKNLSFKDFWSYIQIFADVNLVKGGISVSTDYSLNLAKTTDFNLSKLKIHLLPLALDNSQAKPLLKLTDLLIDNANIDLVKQSVVIDNINSHNFEAWASRLVKLKRKQTGDHAQKKKTNPKTATTKPEQHQTKDKNPVNNWHILLKKISFDNYLVHLTDNKPILKLANLTIKNTKVSLIKKTVAIDNISSNNFEAWASHLVQLQKEQANSSTKNQKANSKTANVVSENNNTKNSTSKSNWDISLKEISFDNYLVHLTDKKPIFNLANLTIKNTNVSLIKKTVSIDDISSHSFEAWASRLKNGKLDLQMLTENNNKPSSNATTKTKSASANDAWRIILNRISLKNYIAHLTDHKPKKVVNLKVGPLNLTATQIDTQGTKPIMFSLDTKLGQKGRISAKGETQIAQTRAAMKLSTQNINLSVVQPYLSPYIHIGLQSGYLSSKLNILLSNKKSLKASIKGDVSIDKLHITDTRKKRDLLRWKRLSIQKLNYQHNRQLSIGAINLKEPYIHIVLNKDKSTNMSTLLVNQSKKTAGSSASSSKKEQSMPIFIGKASIDNGSTHFVDSSISPNFGITLEELNTRIGTISTKKHNPTSVDISAQIDGDAPISINGYLNPFDPLNGLDIESHLKEINLSSFTPYSGKYVGYKIRKGRMNLDVNYKINQGQLKATNELLVEKLTLGDEVDSPDAVDLPLKLGLTLLKDTHGNINISLPLEGDTTNPDFSVTPIILHTLRTLIVKATKAPFKLIGGLIGGSDENLGHIIFTPGDSTLSKDSQGRLNSLAEALAKKSSLTLEIEGVSSPTIDGKALAKKQLEGKYRKLYTSILQRRGETIPKNGKLMNVPQDEKEYLLDAVYRKVFRKQPPVEWHELSKKERNQQLKKALYASWDKSALLLKKLAQKRAKTIKDYLTQHTSLSDKRIYFIDPLIDKKQKGNNVITNLSLDSE